MSLFKFFHSTKTLEEDIQREKDCILRIKQAVSQKCGIDEFIDYDEFCYQVARVVNQKEVTGIINCCSGKPMTLAERVERFIKENNFDIKLEYGAFPDRPYDSKAVWGNDSKIKQIMGK